MHWYSQYFVDAGYEPFFDEVVLMQFARKRFLHERLLYLPERLRKFLSPIWDQGLSENLAQALPAEACKSSTA